MKVPSHYNFVRGQTAIEYLLLLAVVAVVVIASFSPGSLVDQIHSKAGDYYNKVTRAIMGEKPKKQDGDWCPVTCPPAGPFSVIYGACECPEPVFGGKYCPGGPPVHCPAGQTCKGQEVDCGGVGLPPPCPNTCGANDCGTDPCGHSCGTCTLPNVCSSTTGPGSCVPPSPCTGCGASDCGFDNCGNPCGGAGGCCAAGFQCSTSGSLCGTPGGGPGTCTPTTACLPCQTWNGSSCVTTLPCPSGPNVCGFDSCGTPCGGAGGCCAAGSQCSTSGSLCGTLGAGPGTCSSACSGCTVPLGSCNITLGLNSCGESCLGVANTCPITTSPPETCNPISFTCQCGDCNVVPGTCGAGTIAVDSCGHLCADTAICPSGDFCDTNYLCKCQPSGNCQASPGTCGASVEGSDSHCGTSCSAINVTCPSGETCINGLCECQGSGICLASPGTCGTSVETFDSHCGTPCPLILTNVTCPTGQICMNGLCFGSCATCASLGKNCGSISDGCGNPLDCGSCTGAGETCGGGGTANVCGICTPTTCAAQGKNCGPLPSGDGCGNPLNCGSCTGAGETCGGGGTANVCGICTPTTCAAQGKNCGPLPSGDGCGNPLNCGSCTGAGETCGGGGTANVCGICTPTTCAAQGKNCGPLPSGDGCGNPLDCGSCTGAGETCVNNVCASCVPNCTGKACGPDGCGGSCGTCPGSEICTALGLCETSFTVRYTHYGDCQSCAGICSKFNLAGNCGSEPDCRGQVGCPINYAACTLVPSGVGWDCGTCLQTTVIPGSGQTCPDGIAYIAAPPSVLPGQTYDTCSSTGVNIAGTAQETWTVICNP